MIAYIGGHVLCPWPWFILPHLAQDLCSRQHWTKNNWSQTGLELCAVNRGGSREHCSYRTQMDTRSGWEVKTVTVCLQAPSNVAASGGWWPITNCSHSAQACHWGQPIGSLACALNNSNLHTPLNRELKQVEGEKKLKSDRIRCLNLKNNKICNRIASSTIHWSHSVGLMSKLSLPAVLVHTRTGTTDSKVN